MAARRLALTPDDDRSIGEQLAQWGKVALIETSGRRSGRPVRSAVGFVEGDDGSLTIAAGSEGSDWVLNLRADPRCRATIGDRTARYVASEVDGARRARALADLVLKYGTPAERLGHGPVFLLTPDETTHPQRMTARRAAIWLVVGALAMALLARLPPMRTVLFTAALVPEMVLVDPRPLAVLPQPERSTMTYGEPADRLDVYLPFGAGPGANLPAVVLELGVHPQPIDHPDIVRVAAAISRLGVVVAIPDSTDLRNLRVTPAEPAHLADAILKVTQLPQVDVTRVGVAGFSAGASIGLLGAADSRIASNLRWVSSFGGYAEAGRLLVDVATRTSLDQDGRAIYWQPDSGIRHDVLELALATLEVDAQRSELRTLLAPIVAAEHPPSGAVPADLTELNGDALQMYLLFTAPDRATALDAVDGLSERLHAQLAGISPITRADDIRAPVFLLHGVPDTAIPVAHAELLADAIGPEVNRLTVFGQFGHEQPGQRGLGFDDAGDIWELSLYLRDIVAAATE